MYYLGNEYKHNSKGRWCISCGKYIKEFFVSHDKEKSLHNKEIVVQKSIEVCMTSAMKPCQDNIPPGPEGSSVQTPEIKSELELLLNSSVSLFKPRVSFKIS